MDSQLQSKFTAEFERNSNISSLDKLVNSDDLIKNILDLWENVGIESAMEKYYLGYVKSKHELPKRATLSDFGLDEESIAKLFKEGTSEIKARDSDN